MNKQEPVNCSDSELCTYLQALAEGYWPTFYSDTSQSAQSRSMSIASKSYQRGKKTVVFHGFQSLMMCKHSTDGHGADSLTLLPVDSRARTSVLRGKAQDLTANAAGYGASSPASLARYDPDTHSLKTAQLSLIEDSTGFSLTLPRSGWMRNGECYQQPMLVRRTKETGYGLWLYPTPTCNQEAPNHGSNSNGPHNLLDAAIANWKPGMMWPTPTVCGNNNRKGASATSGDGLATAVRKYPTPSATDGQRGGVMTANMTGKSLTQVVNSIERQTFATVIARDWESGKCSPETHAKNSRPLSEQIGGQLNPNWVELLMGWPMKWTDTSPISHVKICFWLMGNTNEKEAGRSEVLRVLRQGNAAQEVWDAIGRFVSIPESAVLLSAVCEHQKRPDEARVFMACAEALEEEVRCVRLRESATGAPHRPGQDKQRAGEHPDAMQALSRLLAYHGKTYWQDGRWENATPRVANGMTARVDRLKSIGNGQVPLCAATAWRMLTS